MKLKKLEINGFKSFADRTEIIFGQGITGIVGPNGCGKSNIGDAVRWVLGEQSPKTLRGSRMEDVIFGGTQKRRRSSFCEVSLLFDNEDGKLKSSYSEVNVTRRVYRDGESEYLLNHVACRLKDIQELFRDTGIGREGYSLIGQGRIDEILSQKSEDRRQVFEEAAGIMTYRVRKEEAERKLARTAEHLSRVYDIIDEIEKHLGKLSSEAEIAKEYRTLFDRMRFLEANVYLIRFDRLNERITQLTQTLDGLRDSLLFDEAKLSSLNAQRDTLNEEMNAIEKEVSEARLTYSAQLQEAHDAEISSERIRHQLEQSLHDHDQTLTSLAALSEEQTRLSDQLSKDQITQESLNTETDRLKTELSKAETESAEDQRSTSEAEEALNAHKRKILETVRQQMDTRETQSRQAAIRDQMLNRITELDSTIESLRSQHSLLAGQVEHDQEEFDSISQLLERARNKAADTSARLNELTDVYRASAADAQKENVQLQTDISRLHLMEEMSRDLAGYQQSVKKALDYAQNKNGVYGVLAKLIDVPSRLETAIDMALGGALQNIVTDTEETAKMIIDYLRINRLGRATFLPVSSIRSRLLSGDERRLLSMPGCLGVASELIGFDAEYRGVVENLLGRTVIADTLDHGIPIMRAAHHAFRLVTLNGDVMHSGGSMTGGTTQNKNISLLGREREIKELREMVRNKRSDLEQLNNELERLNNERQALKQDLADHQKDLQELEISTARMNERLQSDRQDAEQLFQRITEAESAKIQLQETVAEIEEDLNQTNSSVRKDETENQEMERITAELQNKLVQARERADASREKAMSLQLSMNDLNHQSETLRRQIESAQRQLDENRNKSAKLDKSLQALEVQICENRQSAETARLHVSELKKKHETSLQAVEALEQKRTNKSEEQRQLMTDLEEAHTQADADNQRIHKSELSLSKAQSDLAQMTDHLLNAYDLSYNDAQQYRSTTPVELGKADQEILQLRSRIRDMGSVNISAIEAYEEELARYRELTAQRDDLLKAQEDLDALIHRLLKQMEGIFTTEFEKLAGYFKETFVRLFGGGQAELRLAEKDDPLNSGIEIIAQPPGKKLQLLSLLSGGERALTAIAILFAMLKLKPTPFCILDEIEAALDDSNISNFASYLNEYAQTTQFVVVTHRKGTMERCDTLYGVAMEEKGVSRMVSVNLAEYPQ